MKTNNTIKAIRKLLNITQEELAHELKVSFSTINRWENDKNKLSKLAKLRIIEYCKANGIDDNIGKDIESM